MSIIFLMATFIGTATVMAFVIKFTGTPEPRVPSLLRATRRDGANR